jgi:hypothetical protein
MPSTEGALCRAGPRSGPALSRLDRESICPCVGWVCPAARGGIMAEGMSAGNGRPAQCAYAERS